MAARKSDLILEGARRVFNAFSDSAFKIVFFLTTFLYCLQVGQLPSLCVSFYCLLFFCIDIK